MTQQLREENSCPVIINLDDGTVELPPDTVVPELPGLLLSHFYCNHETKMQLSCKNTSTTTSSLARCTMKSKAQEMLFLTRNTIREREFAMICCVIDCNSPSNFYSCLDSRFQAYIRDIFLNMMTLMLASTRKFILFDNIPTVCLFKSFLFLPSPH